MVACLADDAKANTIKEFLKYSGYLPVWSTLLSWVGFLGGVITHTFFRDQFFFKWTPKDHR